MSNTSPPKPLRSLRPARINVRGEVVHLVAPSGFDPDDGRSLVVSLCGRRGVPYTEHLDLHLPEEACTRCDEERARIAELVTSVGLWEIHEADH